MNIFNIILILLILDVGLQLIFKPLKNYLSCGIFAWAGRSVKAFNKDKFNNLGIQNETRGVDSCGIAVDGDCYYGIKELSRYRDFIANTDFNRPKEIPIVIGHTRNSTVGNHSLGNAHPFGFSVSKRSEYMYDFIGVHNGTLHNHKELAEKFNINKQRSGKTQTNTTFWADKIDSEILLEAIYKSNNYKVLGQYNGAAALVFFKPDEPEYLYIYHGESKRSLRSVETTVERDLFVYQHNKNSLYISSLENSLRSIGGTDKTITPVPTNIVFKIRNGNFATAKEIKVSRINQQIDRLTHWEEKQIEKEKNGSTVLKSNSKKKGHNCIVASNPNGGGVGMAPAINFRKDAKEILPGITNIYDDVRLTKKDKQVYDTQLRYFRNGHLLNGVYIWIPTFGFHLAGYDLKGATKLFDSMKNKKFCTAQQKFLVSLTELENPSTYNIPFIDTKDKPLQPLKHMHFFYEGIKIKTYMDWISVKAMASNGTKPTISALSVVSCDPVADISKRYDNNKQGIYLNGVLATATHTMCGGSKIYTIEKGNCIKIGQVDRSEKRKPYSNLKLLVNELEEIENSANKAGKNPSDKKTNVSNINNLFNQDIFDNSSLPFGKDEDDKLEGLIDSIFFTPIDRFRADIEKLNSYKNTSRGKEAIIILNDFLKAASSLIAIDYEYNTPS